LFVDAGFAPQTRHPNAAYYSDHAFCFLVHHTITSQQITNIALTIKNVLSDMQQQLKLK
jgi:dTDP-4-amino-4,6-dideoxygalactose transaminase